MSSSFITPRVFAHVSRPEWGRAVIAEELTDRTTYVFESGGERTFMNAPLRLEEVQLPAVEREALAKTLLKHRGPARLRAATSRAKAAAPSISFEEQEALFTARFGGGFDAETYVREVRGEGEERNVDALIALARELLSVERLDDAIARGAFEEVHAAGAKVLVAAKKFAFAKLDKALYDKLPASAHEKLARALRDLLYGEGPHAPRFNAFVKSIAPTGVPWSIATIFAAAVHPDAHTLVKPATSQRQARVLGLSEPSKAAVSGAAYAKHLAVAQALRERLDAAGKTPRDLFDVYTFTWRTLGAKPPRAKS